MEPRKLSIKDRIANILFAFDCFLFSFCTLGLSYPHESFSSAAWRAEKNGLFYGRFRPKIDRFFAFFGQLGHCEWAYDHAKYNLPEDQR